MIQLIDPVTGAPRAAQGIAGGIGVTLPVDAGVITPDDVLVYDPPIVVWVGDVGPVNVTIAPYGRSGDKTVLYVARRNLTIPVLARQVLATGTNANLLRIGATPPPSISIYRADTTLARADTTVLTADNGQDSRA